jgi:hypothetical protein
MYIWVVLTTFLALIAAYFLPVRPDTQEILTVPVVQANIMQMLVKQEAAKQYMKERAYPFFSTETERKVDFATGELSIDGYLPQGFINNEEYVTVLYCMNEDMTEINTGTDGCYRSDEVKTKRLLMTYGMIPEKWGIISNISSDGSDYDIMPSPDLMQALRNHFGKREMVGYTIEEGGKTYVVNYEGRKFEVPQKVMEDSIATWTLKNCIDNYKSCLVYMSWR